MSREKESAAVSVTSTGGGRVERIETPVSTSNDNRETEDLQAWFVG